MHGLIFVQTPISLHDPYMHVMFSRIHEQNNCFLNLFSNMIHGVWEEIKHEIELEFKKMDVSWNWVSKMEEWV